MVRYLREYVSIAVLLTHHGGPDQGENNCYHSHIFIIINNLCSLPVN